jgi:Protein kinase domain
VGPPTLTPVSVLATESTFAGCRIEGVAGRGGMGVVYRATQLPLDRAVALKVVAPECSSDPRFRRRFERESRIAAALDHPNVVPVYASGEEDGQLYLVMRWVEGTDLHALIADSGPVAPARAAEIVRQVGAALSAAHAAGLVHRDVKPANVLIDGEDGGGHVYLGDFGLTLELAADPRLTQTGEWIGTADFMAPEQFEAGAVDGRTDVYALGCLLYTSLTARAPFKRGTVAATMLAHLRDEPPRASAAASVPAAFDTVIMRALAKRPDDRYPSVEVLVDATSAAAGEAVPAAAPSATAVLQNGSGEPAAGAPATGPTARLTHGRRRPSRGALLGGAGAAAATAAAAAALMVGVGPLGAHEASGPLTRAEVRDAVRSFARAYGTEDDEALAAALTGGVKRVTPGETQRGRRAVLRAYGQQFASNAITGYAFDELDLQPGATARASGRYTVSRAGAGPIKGRIVFGVQRNDGQPRIGLIAATPDR